jgi:hypothetical protein
VKVQVRVNGKNLHMPIITGSTSTKIIWPNIQTPKNSTSTKNSTTTPAPLLAPKSMCRLRVGFINLNLCSTSNFLGNVFKFFWR